MRNPKLCQTLLKIHFLLQYDKSYVNFSKKKSLFTHLAIHTDHLLIGQSVIA